MKETESQNTKNFKSLDEALSENFDINDFSTLPQRLKNVTNQVIKVKDLLPSSHFLLTKRLKKCKTCTKILVKQSRDPNSSSQSETVNFLLRDIVPKVTVYRHTNYQEGKPVDIQLKFLNYNDSAAKIVLSQLTLDQLNEQDEIAKRVNFQCELPKDQFQIESSDILNEFSTNPQQ